MSQGQDIANLTLSSSENDGTTIITSPHNSGESVYSSLKSTLPQSSNDSSKRPRSTSPNNPSKKPNTGSNGPSGSHQESSSSHSYSSRTVTFQDSGLDPPSPDPNVNCTPFIDSTPVYDLSLREIDAETFSLREFVRNARIRIHDLVNEKNSRNQRKQELRRRQHRARLAGALSQYDHDT